ncbi:FMN reductase [Nocardioides sp. CFH 31398]|uniref:FMN reductase n=1 Tax=Nocardioides sp. CFH 31398 TaxID=2919579 RepID=UPI001F05CF22|nr:FMN reductase [Nocardioides sp. CFH 31398]MCH1866808.1 FMN reductase [Nocardioides sp. CFH 31398]
MTRSLVVVSAGLGVPSSTTALAERLGAAAASALRDAGERVEVTHVELRPLAHALADRMLTGFATGDLDEALRTVSRADALVVATPVFTASYSGLFKTFVDALDPDALVGTPVLVAATAGTARHSLVIDHALRPLFAYLKAVVVPTGVFAASEDFGAGGGQDALGSRIDRAAGELAALVAGLPTRRTPLRAVSDPAEDVDDLPEPVPFEQLLHPR